jgi:hypothetical protein
MVALSLGGLVIYASAFQQDQGTTLTGCLNPGGDLKNVAVGDTPSKVCAKNETRVHLGTTYSGADFALSNQSCAGGKFVSGIDDKGKIQCNPSITLTQLAKGDQNCAEGGLAVSAGGGVYYVCNGAAGPTGTQGPTGPAGPAGPQGPAGSISNASSGNGLFKISLTNAGLVLKGPGGTITIDRSAVVVHGTP